MKKNPISVIIPTYNEERNIEDCLKSIEWADEIIVVDGGSADRTRAIALGFTAHVIVTDNAPAETQRLKGIQRARNPWFFLLDADERVTDELRNSIAAAVSDPAPVQAYRVLRNNYRNGKAVHLHYPDYQFRLFRRETGHLLPEKIHRIPHIKGRTGTLKGELIHHFFISMHDYTAKLHRYTLQEASYAISEGRRVKGFWRGVHALWLRPTGKFFQYYFLKGGIRDGFFGLFFSGMSGIYEFMVAVLVREKEKD